MNKLTWNSGAPLIALVNLPIKLNVLLLNKTCIPLLDVVVYPGSEVLLQDRVQNIYDELYHLKGWVLAVKSTWLLEEFMYRSLNHQNLTWNFNGKMAIEIEDLPDGGTSWALAWVESTLPVLGGDATQPIRSSSQEWGSRTVERTGARRLLHWCISWIHWTCLSSARLWPYL